MALVVAAVTVLANAAGALAAGPEGLPIGTGVMEAACKTLVTQRLKQSGMRWGHKGGQAILNPTQRPPGSLSPAYTAPPPAQKQAPGVEKRLKVFDVLDFDVFSNQKWDRLSESHSKDIVVTWPDGHETHGIDKHIEDLTAMFVYAPDIKISEHPIRFGSGDWTAVTGFMTGTFTKPMPIGGGKTIPPTGKAFRLGMATIGHWKGGTMDHEWLFWDSQDFMKQLGLAK